MHLSSLQRTDHEKWQIYQREGETGWTTTTHLVERSQVTMAKYTALSDWNPSILLSCTLRKAGILPYFNYDCVPFTQEDVETASWNLTGLSKNTGNKRNTAIFCLRARQPFSGDNGWFPDRHGRKNGFFYQFCCPCQMQIRWFSPFPHSSFLALPPSLPSLPSFTLVLWPSLPLLHECLHGNSG